MLDLIVNEDDSDQCLVYASEVFLCTYDKMKIYLSSLFFLHKGFAS